MSLYMAGIINVTLDVGRGCCLEHLYVDKYMAFPDKQILHICFCGQNHNTMILSIRLGFNIFFLSSMWVLH